MCDLIICFNVRFKFVSQYFHAVHLPAHAVYVEVVRLLTSSQCTVAIQANTRKPLVIGATCMSQLGQGHDLKPSFSFLTATEL